MVYHTFVSGEVLTAANVMNDLMNQSVIVCTSGTRPASPVAGMTIFETDTLNTVQYNGTAWVIAASLSAWTTYSPGWTAGSSPALGTNAGRYLQTGKLVTATINVQASGTATSGAFASTLPLAPRAGTSVSQPLGTVAYFVSATGVTRLGACFWTGTTTGLRFQLDNTTGFLTASIAASDAVLATVTYEAA